MNWIPADELETAILERLDLALEDEGYLNNLEVKIEKMATGRHADWRMEREKLEAEATKIEAAIRRTIKVQADCADISVDDVFRDELRSFADQKRANKVRLDEIESQQQEVIASKEAKTAVQINTHVFKKAFAKAKNVVRKRSAWGHF